MSTVGDPHIFFLIRAGLIDICIVESTVTHLVDPVCEVLFAIVELPDETY
jgi:hypothetical protein